MVLLARVDNDYGFSILRVERSAGEPLCKPGVPKDLLGDGWENFHHCFLAEDVLRFRSSVEDSALAGGFTGRIPSDTC